MNGPEAFLSYRAAQRPTCLACIDERETADHGTRFWELTLHKTAAGGYVLESVLRGTRGRHRPLAAAMSFADSRELLDFLIAPGVASPLAQGLIDRAAGFDPAFGPRRTP